MRPVQKCAGLCSRYASGLVRLWMGLRVSVLYAHQTALSNGFRNPNFVGKVQISAEILFQWTGRRFFSGAVGIAAKAGMKAWFSVKATGFHAGCHQIWKIITNLVFEFENEFFCVKFVHPDKSNRFVTTQKPCLQLENKNKVEKNAYTSPLVWNKYINLMNIYTNRRQLPVSFSPPRGRHPLAGCRKPVGILPDRRWEAGKSELAENRKKGDKKDGRVCVRLF